jgi:hypothetical protein
MPQASDDSPASTDPLLAALRAIELAPVPGGDGAITGKVLTFDGQPVPGVTVQLIPPFHERYVSPVAINSDNPDPWGALPGAVRKFVRYRLASRPTQCTGVTAADGAFRIDGLADVEHAVTAILEGFEFEYPGPANRVNRWRPGAEVLIHAVPTTEVSLRIEPMAGVEPHNLHVTHRNFAEGNSEMHLRNQEGGVWTVFVRPGVHLFTVWISDTNTPGKPALLRVEAGMGPQELTLKLEPVTRVSGRVTCSEGSPPGDTHVVCTPLEPGVAVKVQLLEAIRNRKNLARVNLGRYGFPGLAPGTYAMCVTIGGGVLEPQTVVHPGGSTAVDFSVSPPSAGECIVCVVKTHDGQPLVSPTFGVRARHNAPVRHFDAWELAPGEYRLTGIKGDVAPPAELVVEDRRRGKAVAPLNSLGPQRITIEFAQTALLLLRVQNWERTSKPGLYLEVRDDQDRVVASRGMDMHVDDFLSFSRVPIGAVRIDFSIRHGREVIPLSSQPATVVPDGTIAEVTPPKLYEVTITAPEGDPIMVKIEGEFGGKMIERGVLLANEPAKVGPFPAGRYTVKWRPRGAQEEKIDCFELPGQTSVNLAG